MSNIWGIHTKNENFFVDDSIIALGWKRTGDINECCGDRCSLKEKYLKAYPDAKKANVSAATGMLYRFCYEAKAGDYVVYPSKADRTVHIGQIESDYFYSPEFHDYVHRRKVKWLKHFPRTFFSQGALYELGTQLSFFAIKSYADEFVSAIFSKYPEKEDYEITVGNSADEIIEATKDFILKELGSKLKGYDFEEFVAELLNAMGYRTVVSPRGGDSGIDITAYKDELPPRIVVQVKSQSSNIKETTIQSLRGAMHEGDYGLFVTISDYSKKARQYLESTPIIRGINGNDLAELILKYYDRMNDKYKRIIPLKMVYIPVIAEMTDD